MKRITALFLALTMTFLLCACQTPASPVPTPEPTTPTETAEPYNVISYRSHGKRISLYSMPESVMTVGPNCTEVFCALGLEDKVVGKCMTNHTHGTLKNFADAWDSIPVVSIGYPTLDEIVSSGCDFVYATEWLFDDTLTVEQLESRGIHVYVSSAFTYGELWREIRDMGAIFHADEEAESFIESEKTRIEKVENTLLSVEAKPVLVLDSFLDDKVYTAGGNNIETQYLRSAGCRNVFSELQKPWDAVSKEDIAALDPYFIVIHDYAGSGYDAKVKALSADPVLGKLDCVKDGRFIRMPLENVMPGARSAAAVEIIAYTVFYDVFHAASAEQKNA